MTIIIFCTHHPNGYAVQTPRRTKARLSNVQWVMLALAHAWVREPFAVGGALNRGDRRKPCQTSLGAGSEWADPRPAAQGRPDVRGAGRQPRCLRSQRRPVATVPHACRPARVRRPVKMMISVMSGRIASGLLARDNDALHLAPAPGVRRLGLDRADVAAGQCPEPLDHEPVVAFEAAAEIVDQKRGHAIAGYRHRCRHGGASVVPVMGNGGGASLRDTLRRPASGQPVLSAARGTIAHNGPCPAFPPDRGRAGGEWAAELRCSSPVRRLQVYSGCAI